MPRAARVTGRDLTRHAAHRDRAGRPPTTIDTCKGGAMVTTPERLAGVRGDFLYDTLVSAVRGHLGIHAGDLVALARERGLTVPAGEPAARGPEWAALLEALAGVEPLASAAGRPVHLLAIVRDLTDLVEGPSLPAAWWQRLLGMGGAPPPDPAAVALLPILRKLSDGLELHPDLVRPLIGRFNGALTEAETADLSRRLEALGRAGWIALGATGVSQHLWGDCYDVLAAAAAEATGRSLGLLYDSGY
jgi:hypothetical protein